MELLHKHLNKTKDINKFKFMGKEYKFLLPSHSFFIQLAHLHLIKSLSSSVAGIGNVYCIFRGNVRIGDIKVYGDELILPVSLLTVESILCLISQPSAPASAVELYPYLTSLTHAFEI